MSGYDVHPNNVGLEYQAQHITLLGPEKAKHLVRQLALAGYFVLALHLYHDGVQPLYPVKVNNVWIRSNIVVNGIV